MRLFNALRSRSFTLLWIGQTVSRVGDGLFAIALSWWVLEKTGSPAAMGAVQVFTILPKVLFLLIGGVMADRLPRQRVMIASDALRGVLVIIVAILAATQLLQIWHIFAASLLFGFVDAFFQPAYAAVMPDITPPELLPSANSLTALSGELAGIGGPAIGAFVVAVGGTPAAFGLDGVSFLISALCIVPIMGLALKRKNDAPPPNVIRELREGLGVVFGSPWLWITITLAAFGNIFLASPITVSLPFLIKDNLHADVGVLGAVFSIFSIGSVIGAVLVGRVPKLRHRGRTTYIAWIIAGLSLALIGVIPSVASLIVLSFIAGVGLAIGQLIWTNVLQELVAPELLGRVSSVDQFGSFVLLPFGFGIVGGLTGLIGAPLVFALGGGLAAATIAIGLLHPAVRNLD